MESAVSILHWTPSGWQRKAAAHQPDYPSEPALRAALEVLHQRAPLVTVREIENLKRQLADAVTGKRFLLQGGDCAENFADSNPRAISAKMKILMQVGLVLLGGLRRSVIHVGRLAGQYAKPRSAPTETRNGVTLTSYLGDLVNRPEFDADARMPDPNRMVEAHDRAAQTLNYIRALLDGGFDDLVDSVRPEFFTSHESLHLHYEQTQTLWDERRERWYLGSTHFPWIGMRTSNPDGAHVEFCRGLANPIGLKVGPGFDADAIARTVEMLDPEREPGRLTLIHRFGVAAIERDLPRCLEVIRATGHPVLWSCDPMHGNTQVTASGLKTRRFDDILGELRSAFVIHADAGQPLGGVHIELTGDDVTECIGGARGLGEADLERAYRSNCDPRLNYEQALELATAITSRPAV